MGIALDMNRGTFADRQLDDDSSGLLEKCDKCAKMILNWRTLSRCYLSHDGGEILCEKCHNADEGLTNFKLVGKLHL